MAINERIDNIKNEITTLLYEIRELPVNDPEVFSFEVVHLYGHIHG